MGYPEDVLAPDEELILHRHPHWKMLFWPVVTLIVATAVAGFAGGVAYRNTETPGRSILLLVIFLVWLLLVIWRCVVPLSSWKSTPFIIPPPRVLLRPGVIIRT